MAEKLGSATIDKDLSSSKVTGGACCPMATTIEGEGRMVPARRASAVAW